MSRDSCKRRQSRQPIRFYRELLILCTLLGLSSHFSMLHAQERLSSPLIVPSELREELSPHASDKQAHSQGTEEASSPSTLDSAPNEVPDRKLGLDLYRDESLPTPDPLSSAEVRLAFDRGRNAYLYGSYKEAVDNLTPLLSPAVLIADPQMLTLAYEYLGLAHFYLGHKERATGYFKDLIYFRPEHRLDPVRVPPNAVSLYNQLHIALQEELTQRQEAMARQAELEEERRLRKMRLPIVLERQVNQKLIAFLPFGAGQFQNQEPGLGYFFLGSELIAVGLSAGFFWGVESLRQSDGRFVKRDYLFAQQLQRAQLISGGVAIGLMVSGVILALLRYQDRHDLGNYLDLNQLEQDEYIDESSLGAPVPPLTPLEEN